MRHIRRKIKAALKQHVQDSERASLEADLAKAGLEGAVRIAAEVPPPAKVPAIDNEVGDNLKRSIPTNYDYNPKALKPLAETLWALSIALGHAMTAHRKFTKLKSSTISPDGMLGGRGYVMSVKDVRNALYEACEAISAVSDTLHDEIHAPHWRPRLSELEQADKDSVERLVGDAHENLDNPESDIEEQMQDAEMTGSPVDLTSGPEDSGVGEGEDSGLAEQALEEQGIEDPEGADLSADPEETSETESDTFLSPEEQESLGALDSDDAEEESAPEAMADDWSDETSDEDEADNSNAEMSGEDMPEDEMPEEGHEMGDEMPEGEEELPEEDSEEPELESDETDTPMEDEWADESAGEPESGDVPETEELSEETTEDSEEDPDEAGEEPVEGDETEDDSEDEPTEDDENPEGESSEDGEDNWDEEEPVDGGEQAEASRFDNAEEQVSPEDLAALTEEAESDEDEDEDEDPMSALPGTGDGLKGKKLKLASSVLARFGNSSLPVQTLPGPRVQHLDRADQDQTGPFGSYNSDEPHSDHDEWSRNEGTGKKIATSSMPDKNSEPTQTQGWDFGIGYGKGNDAHGQGAGGYANPTSDGKGVYGPASGLPHPPGGDHKDVSTPQVELETGRSNRQADRWKADSKLPNDGQGGVARSDYYRGDKPSNMMNTVRGQSEVPGDAKNDYDHSIDMNPGTGYRFEQGAQPYTKWDSTTRNMKVDDINQRDVNGPYVRKGKTNGR